MDTKDPKLNQTDSNSTVNTQPNTSTLNPVNPSPVQTPLTPPFNNPPVPQTTFPASITQPIAQVEDIPQVVNTETPQNMQNQSSNIIPPLNNKGKGKLFAAIGGLLTLLIAVGVGIYLINQRQSLTNQAAPSFTFQGGYYINLAGGGSDPNGNISNYNDEADCDPNLGVCKAKNKNNGQDYAGGNVQKYICSGKVQNCDNTSSPGQVIKGPDYSSVHYIYDTNYAPIQCNQTIQLDVFNGQGVLKGFMTWYSGDCVGTPTPISTVTTCNNRTITRAVLVQELQLANYPGPWGDINVELAAFNRAACPTPSPSAVPSTAPTPSLSPSTIPSISPSPIASKTPSPSPIVSSSPISTPRASSSPVVANASPKPKSPSPSPVVSLPPAGNSTPLIVAAGTGILLLFVGLLFAL